MNYLNKRRGSPKPAVQRKPQEDGLPKTARVKTSRRGLGGMGRNPAMGMSSGGMATKKSSKPKAK